MGEGSWGRWFRGGRTRRGLFVILELGFTDVLMACFGMGGREEWRSGGLFDVLKRFCWRADGLICDESGGEAEEEGDG